MVSGSPTMMPMSPAAILFQFLAKIPSPQRFRPGPFRYENGNRPKRLLLPTGRRTQGSAATIGQGKKSDLRDWWAAPTLLRLYVSRAPATEIHPHPHASLRTGSKSPDSLRSYGIKTLPSRERLEMRPPYRTGVRILLRLRPPTRASYGVQEVMTSRYQNDNMPSSTPA